MINQLLLIFCLAIAVLFCVKKNYEQDWRDVMDSVWEDLAHKAISSISSEFSIPRDVTYMRVVMTNTSPDENLEIKIQGMK